MKKLLILISVLSFFAAQAQNNFPVDTKGSYVKVPNDEQSIRLGARPIQGMYTTSSGPQIDAIQSNSTAAGWLTTTVPTNLSANIAQPLLSLTRIVPIGRAWRIKSIDVEVSDSCTFYIQWLGSYAFGSYNTAGTVGNQVKYFKDPGHSRQTITFSPALILRYGQRFQCYYWRSSNKGVNVALSLNGDDIPNDFNVSAPYSALFIGDSQSGISADAGADQSSTWSYIVRDSLIANGKSTRIDQRAIGGTNAQQWLQWLTNEEYVGMETKFQIAFVNLGMNDCNGGSAGLSTFTSNMIAIGKRLHLIALAQHATGKPIIFNAITPSDDPAKTALSQYNTAIQSVVSTLQAQGIPAYYADVSNAYSSSTGAAYVSTNQTAGTRVHANTTVGQPAMAALIWNTIKTALFQGKTPFQRM